MLTRVSASIDDYPVSLLFITMIPILINPKIANFSLYLFVYFFGNKYNIDELTSTTSKERMTMN